MHAQVTSAPPHSIAIPAKRSGIAQIDEHAAAARQQRQVTAIYGPGHGSHPLGHLSVGVVHLQHMKA